MTDSVSLSRNRISLPRKHPYSVGNNNSDYDVGPIIRPPSKDVIASLRKHV